MLVLTRKVGQWLDCGDVHICIVRIGAGVVRIGIEAAEDVPITRREVTERDANEPTDAPATTASTMEKPQDVGRCQPGG